MTGHKPPARDVAAEITTLIIAKLEAGVPPWTRPWQATGGGGRPLRHCGTPYTGINTLYLWAIADGRGYRSRYWMTYRQATTLGGQVRCGETGSLSVYYSSFRKDDTEPRTGEERERTVRFLRAYTVFNADQIDGLPARFYASDEAPATRSASAHQDGIEAFFGRIPAVVRHGGDRAYFDPHADRIQLPQPAAFRSADYYASVRAHETIHWTGAKTRLDRAFGKRFGDKAYAFEELVAEIGSGLVCAALGLPNELHDGHASYVAHWLSILRADKTAIIHAASKAEAAYAFLAGFGDAEAAPATGRAHDLDLVA